MLQSKKRPAKDKNMNLKLEKFVYHTCAYSVIISLLFYVFAAIAKSPELTMSFGRFALIVAFSLVVTFAESLLYIKKIKKPFAIFIHFAALFVAFFVVFIAINNKGFLPSFIFSSLAIFTLLYVLVLLCAILLKKASKKIPLESSSKKESNEKKYSPRFSKD